jgi:hypothetical protein
LCKPEGPIRRTREGRSEWEPIKILLKGDEDSNKTNTASNTRLKDRNGEPERGGGSEWEPIKILFKNLTYEPDSTRAPPQASLV